MKFHKCVQVHATLYTEFASRATIKTNNIFYHIITTPWTYVTWFTTFHVSFWNGITNFFLPFFKGCSSITVVYCFARWLIGISYRNFMGKSRSWYNICLFSRFPYISLYGWSTLKTNVNNTEYSFLKVFFTILAIKIWNINTNIH